MGLHALGQQVGGGLVARLLHRREDLARGAHHDRKPLPDVERGDPRLAGRRVSARFTDETLLEMLDALTLALGARWEQSGRSITISPAVP